MDSSPSSSKSSISGRLNSQWKKVINPKVRVRRRNGLSRYPSTRSLRKSSASTVTPLGGSSRSCSYRTRLTADFDEDDNDENEDPGEHEFTRLVNPSDDDDDDARSDLSAFESRPAVKNTVLRRPALGQRRSTGSWEIVQEDDIPEITEEGARLYGQVVMTTGQVQLDLSSSGDLVETSTPNSLGSRSHKDASSSPSTSPSSGGPTTAVALRRSPTELLHSLDLTRVMLLQHLQPPGLSPNFFLPPPKRSSSSASGSSSRSSPLRQRRSRCPLPPSHRRTESHTPRSEHSSPVQSPILISRAPGSPEAVQTAIAQILSSTVGPLASRSVIHEAGDVDCASLAGSWITITEDIVNPPLVSSNSTPHVSDVSRHHRHALNQFLRRVRRLLSKRRCLCGDADSAVVNHPSGLGARIGARSVECH